MTLKLIVQTFLKEVIERNNLHSPALPVIMGYLLTDSLSDKLFRVRADNSGIELDEHIRGKLRSVG